MDAAIGIEKDFDLTEIINGEEITNMGPSPFGSHTALAYKLARLISAHTDKTKLGEVFVAPIDVIFEEGVNRFQPDVFFICKTNMAIFQDWVRGVPDMVCEIVSSGSYDRDTVVKRAIYEKYRVPEYWVVMPEMQTVEILTIDGDKYKLHSIAAFEGVVTSKVIEGLQIDISEIFQKFLFV